MDGDGGYRDGGLKRKQVEVNWSSILETGDACCLRSVETAAAKCGARWLEQFINLE